MMSVFVVCNIIINSVDGIVVVISGYCGCTYPIRVRCYRIQMEVIIAIVMMMVWRVAVG